MKKSQKIVSAALALTMVFGVNGITGCKEQPFMSDEKLCKVADRLKLEKMEYAFDYMEMATSMRDKCNIYYSVAGDDAQECFDHVVGYYGNYYNYHVASFTGCYMVDKDGTNNVWLITFEYADDANRFYDEYTSVEMFVDDGNEGDDVHYEYAIDTEDIDGSDLECWWGVYLMEETNSVLVIDSVTEDTEFIEAVCRDLKIIPPTEA